MIARPAWVNESRIQANQIERIGSGEKQMITNATMRRLDPAGGPEGPEIAIRCALTPLTAAQQRTNEEAGWDATNVMYISLKAAPVPWPEPAGIVVVQADVDETPRVYVIRFLIESTGPTLGFIQVYLVRGSEG